ncbi:hypothetical protein [Pseudomonas corrugata]|uniref:hypothetical protein n=1 Tax=Pseudomonas corrugata TaxID=47879 RepID=UPI0006D8C503|nr:hypothetical protein [Pseudomonas corrugata]
MLQKEIVIRFTGAGVLRFLFLSPVVLIPSYLVFSLPWESSNAPAWVQAVGSIAAIIAAWMIPHRHEQMRIRKQKEDLLASVSWLALRVKNSFEHMAGVIGESKAGPRDRWLFLSGPLCWTVDRNAAQEFPITGFTHDEISWLLSLRAITEFGTSCAEALARWDFAAAPDLSKDFPYYEGIEFHRPHIEWVLKQLP